VHFEHRLRCAGIPLVGRLRSLGMQSRHYLGNQAELSATAILDSFNIAVGSLVGFAGLPGSELVCLRLATTIMGLPEADIELSARLLPLAAARRPPLCAQNHRLSAGGHPDPRPIRTWRLDQGNIDGNSSSR